MKTPKTLTALNVWALKQVIESCPDGVIRRVHATDIPHLKRCIFFGLLEATSEKVGRGAAWRLTDKGRAAVAEVK